MQTKDMKTGVLYACQTSKYVTPLPVVVLDVEHLYSAREWPSTYRSAPLQEPTEAGMRRIQEAEQRRALALQQSAWEERPLRHGVTTGSSEYGLRTRPRGYLAVGYGVQMYGSDPIDVDDASYHRRLLSVTLDEVLAVTGEQSLVGHLGDLAVGVITPRWLKGEWAKIREEHLDAKELEANLAAQAKAASQERVAAAMQRIEGLRDLGLPGRIADAAESLSYSTPREWKGNTSSVSLTMAQVDALLSLIPSGARYRAPETQPVEDDGWTYAKPEYEE